MHLVYELPPNQLQRNLATQTLILNIELSFETNPPSGQSVMSNCFIKIKLCNISNTIGSKCFFTVRHLEQCKRFTTCGSWIVSLQYYFSYKGIIHTSDSISFETLQIRWQYNGHNETVYDLRNTVFIFQIPKIFNFKYLYLTSKVCFSKYV